MKYALILAIALAAACGKEETPASKTYPTAPGVKVETPPLTVPDEPAAEKPAVPSMDAAKAALDKAIADTKALIQQKEQALKALTDKIAADPMKAATYKGEADALQRELADLKAKLEGYMKEAAAK